VTVYSYKARDIKGDIISGTVEAPTIESAGEQLDRLDYTPVAIKEEAPPSPFSASIAGFFGERVTTDDMTMFTFQMSTLIGAGIPLIACLNTLVEQIKNPALRNILMQASKDIEEGSSLSASLAKHSNVFPELYINMIRAGEASGRLQEIFERMGVMVEHEAQTRNKIKEATRYPKLVLITLGLAFVVLVTFVIPKFVMIFERFKLELPLPTRVLIVLNMIVQNYWYFAVIAVTLSIFLFKWCINTPKGRHVWDNFKIEVPILGPLSLKVAMSRFAHILGMLNQSGLPIIENLRLTAMTIGNVVISKALHNIRENIQEGRGLSESMQEHKIFTPLVVQMVSVGESSGTIDEILNKVSRYYDLEVDQGTKKFATHIEPLLIVVLGVTVLFFALAIFLPLWDLTGIAKVR
jgi:type II secretory pathway component PulF